MTTSTVRMITMIRDDDGAETATATAAVAVTATATATTKTTTRTKIFLRAAYMVAIVTLYWSQVRRSTVSTDTANDIVLWAHGILNSLAFLQSIAIFHIHGLVCIHRVLQLICLKSSRRTTLDSCA